MGKIIYGMSVSLDGFMEGEGGDIDWAAPDPELHQYFNDWECTIAVNLYGRRMYETMSAFWPTADEDPHAPEVVKEDARMWRNRPKVVFSRTLKQVRWNARLAQGDIIGEFHRLKEEAGGDMSVSGAGIAASFTRLGLIDEYWLYLHPVILGGGKTMFGSLDERLSLQLMETRRFGQGVILLKYRRVDSRQ